MIERLVQKLSPVCVVRCLLVPHCFSRSGFVCIGLDFLRSLWVVVVDGAALLFLRSHVPSVTSGGQRTRRVYV